MQPRFGTSSTGPFNFVGPFGKRPCVSEEDEPSAATDSGLLSPTVCPRKSDERDRKRHRDPNAAIYNAGTDLTIAGGSTGVSD